MKNFVKALLEIIPKKLAENYEKKNVKNFTKILMVLFLQKNKREILFFF
jgi:hypothetical protein